MDPGF